MSIKKRNVDFDHEKKIRGFKKKNIIDKHKKLIYNIATSKKSEDEADDLDYGYETIIKIKRR